MRRRGTIARFAMLLASGAAACAQEQRHPQSSATVVVAPPASEEPKYAMLVALPGDASDGSEGGLPPPALADALRRMNDPDSGPPPEQRGLHCTCHPAAFAPTPYQRNALDRIRKFAEQFRAAGDEGAAAQLQRDVDQTEKAAQVQCVELCAKQ